MVVAVIVAVWNFASSVISGCLGSSDDGKRAGTSHPECSDDDASSCASGKEGLECPICWESFNIVENVPYVLWCGHTLCKNCVLVFQWAVVKFPTVPLQLPLFISCPWCHLLSFRLVYKGTLKFPRKNFFLLWMVESMNGDRAKSSGSSFCGDRQSIWPSSSSLAMGSNGHLHHPRRVSYVQALSYLNMERINSSLRKLLVFFVNMTAKFPLVIIFLLIILYAIPASATILALYIVVTVVFALPSFLILYFAYPILDWLIREIIT